MRSSILISMTKRKQLFNVKIVSIDGGPVNCLNRLLITPHLAIDDVGDTDLILISSILDIEKTLKYEGKVIPWLVKHYQPSYF
ncbi:MAG: hypothetical protein ABIJ59_08495 [Pseudomonadota bacterium]